MKITQERKNILDSITKIQEQINKSNSKAEVFDLEMYLETLKDELEQTK